MQFTALAVLLFIAVVSTFSVPDAEGGYHNLVGIPMAKRVKEREDRIHSEAKSRIYRGKKVFSISSPSTYAFFGGLIVNTVNRTGFHQQSGCGSSLLTFKRLVTAAHCWDDGHVTATHMTVVLGSTFLFYGGVRMNTSEVVTHPNWNSHTLHNDIAMIYLPNKVNLDLTIFPIALPEGTEITQEWDLHYASAFGFGHTENLHEDHLNSDGPSLRSVVLQLISNEKCSRELYYTVYNEQMCSSGAEGKGPCHGDSGGPLVTYTNRKFLVGITSYMKHLCGIKPHIYTRVGMYMDFITSHAKLPKFEFRFGEQDGEFFENITGGLIVNTVDRKGFHHESLCGSSLLTFKRLVTAAHCWDDGHVTATHMTVVLGSTFLFYGGVRMNTSEVVTHPNWNSVTLDNDIAIIYLPNKGNLDSSIFPIALPEGEEITQEWDLHYASAFGFGATENFNKDYFNSDGPSLRTVVLQIISNGKCSKQMWYPPSTGQMCSSGAEGKGPCNGDSGGPLVTYTNRKFLVGITSYMEGLVCGQKPNIFTRVGMYMDFIASHTKLPKFEFHFDVKDGEFYENITVHIADIE